MNKVLGIIFSNMHEQTVTELTANRCMGSIPVAGRYRLIDFPISNMSNSGIEQVGVVAKSNYQSLMDHLGSGREWDLARKNGGLVILPPFGRAAAGIYRSRVEALSGIMGYIKSSGASEVLTTDCDTMANINYKSVINAHRESGAKVTLMYKKVDVIAGHGQDYTSINIGSDGFVDDMTVSSLPIGQQNIYINMMVANRDYLEQVVNSCYSRSKFSFETDIMQASIEKKYVYSYEFKDHIARFNTMQGYYKTNMSLLNSEVRDSLFNPERPIYTKVRDEAPVRYGLTNHVSNSLIADGCVIEGHVENSVLFRGVKIAKGVKIKNCILMQGTSVAMNSNLECVITDKDVTIREGRNMIGFETYPIYIAKKSAV